MRAIHHWSGFALLMLIAMPCAAEKVTTDPNAGPAKPAVSGSSEPDPRLTQLVTYDGGYARLHTIIDDISARTGVKIRCGANNVDWQIRDLPMAVSVQNIPLGKLLESIASAANLELIAESISNEKGASGKQYRLSLSGRARRALDEYLNSKHLASVDRESRMWDALVAHADIPESDYSPNNGYGAKTAPILSNILKDLGADAKAKVLSGQKVDLSTRDYGRADLLRAMNQAQSDQYSAMMAKSGISLQTGDSGVDLPITLSIMPNDDPATGEFTIIAVMPVRLGSVTLAAGVSLDTAAYQLWRNTRGHDVPQVINGKQPAAQLPDHVSKDLVALTNEADALAKYPLLKQKVDLGLPSDEDVTYAQALAALAKASGTSIIIEDFLDHKRQQSFQIIRSASGSGGVTSKISSTFAVGKGGATAARPVTVDQPDDKPFSPVSDLGKDATVGDVLKAVTKSQFGPDNFEWFYDEKANLLVARPPDWIRKHTNLMPESLLAELKKKADSAGLDLDDVCKLMAFNQTQVMEWVRDSKELGFNFYPMAQPPSDVFWKVYEKLSPEDKATAKSDAGLPLAKFDTTWVADFVKSGINSDKTIHLYGGSSESVKKTSEDTARKTALLTDPDVMRTLTLKIVKEPAHRIRTMYPVTALISGDADGWTYRPKLQGEYKGNKIDETLDPLYQGFPIYTAKREAELDSQNNPKPTK